MADSNQTVYSINSGELSQGLHQYKFMVTDRAFNSSGNTAVYSFTYDTIVNPPLLDLETSNIGQDVSLGYLGKNDLPTYIKFSAENASTIGVFRNDSKMNSAVVEEYETGKKIKTSILDVSDKGAILKLDNNLEGIVLFKSLSKEEKKQIKEVFVPDFELEASVQEVDEELKKIIFLVDFSEFLTDSSEEAKNTEE